MLIVFILIFSFVTESFGNTCAYLFQDSALSYIEDVNRSNNGFLSNDAPVEYQIFNLKNRQKKKAQNILSRLRKGDIASEKDLSRVSEELVILIYGKRDAVTRYFFKNKSQREMDSIRFQIKKQLMEQGLKSFMKDRPAAMKVSLWITLKKNVRRVLQSQVLNVLQLPFSLPNFKDKPISEELMTKIIWEGIPANQKEIEAYLGKQAPREAYASIRGIYAMVFIGILSVHGYQEGVERHEREQAAKVEVVTTQLDYIAENLPKEIRAYKLELKEDALKKAIEEYKLELKRDPTLEEIQEMRTIIFED